MKEQILAVQRMQDFIEKHLEGDISLSDLSKVSMFSPWHSYRLFSEYTGLTVGSYIRRLKLSKSAMRLKNEGCHITDVAYDLGFESVEGYQRAFRREFGCNPKCFAKNPFPITLFIPYGVKFRYLQKERNQMQNVKNVFIQPVHKCERKVIIKRGIKADDYFSYCEEVGCYTWGTLLSMDSMCGEPVCLWLTGEYLKPDTSVYVQGIEVPVDYDGIIPEGFDVITLLEADYLMFQGEPFEEEDYCEAIDAVQQSIDKYDPLVIGYEWDKKNPRIQLEPRGERGYIELLPVLRKNIQ